MSDTRTRKRTKDNASSDPEATVDFAAFDCDNHYYEAPDAFMRHVPEDMRRRCVEWCEINGRRYRRCRGQGFTRGQEPDV